MRIFGLALAVACGIAIAAPAQAGTYTARIKQCNEIANAKQKSNCVAQARQIKAANVKKCNAIANATQRRQCLNRVA